MPIMRTAIPTTLALTLVALLTSSTRAADFVVWAYDCAGGDGWTRVLSAPTRSLAERSVERLEQRGTATVHYEYTSGAKPTTNPCRSVVTPEDTSLAGRHDLDILGPNEAAEHTFTLKNPTAAPIELRLVDRSCPCVSVTVNGVALADGPGSGSSDTPGEFLPPPPEAVGRPPGVDEAPSGPPAAGPEAPPTAGPPGTGDVGVSIAPGAEARITLAWTTDGLRGPFEYDVTLGTDGGKQLTYRVRGRVEPWFELIEGTADLGDLPDGQGTTGTFHLVSRRADAFDVRQIVPSSPLLSVEIAPLVEMPEPTVHCGVILNVTVAKGLPVGRILEELAIYTSHESAPELRVPVRGRVTSPDVTFSQQGIGLDGSGRTKGLYLKFETDRSPRVKLASAPDGIDVAVHEFTAGSAYFVIVEATPEAGSEPVDSNASIELQTSLSSPQRIRIPLVADFDIGVPAPAIDVSVDPSDATPPGDPGTPPGVSPGTPPGTPPE